MSGILWPRGNNAAPDIAGFRVQTSVYGLPIPIVYGWARVAGNLIDFVPGSITSASEKPSKWASPVQTGWNYINAVAIGLCEGEIDGIGDVWSDKNEKVDFAAVFQADFGWDLKVGTIAQTRLTYLSSLARYQFTAYVGNAALNMPNNVLPSFSWEVKGLLPFGGGIVDAIPSDVLPDFLTSENYGANFPASSIASLSTYEDYCAAAGLFVSPVISALRPAADFIDELMIASNSEIVWFDGLLHVIPRGDQNLTGNGHTYTAPNTPIYDFGDNDYLDKDNPIQIRRKDPAERYNQVFVEFDNRDADYNKDVREAKIDDDVIVNGLLPAPKISLPMIKDPDVARLVAQLQVQRAYYIVNEYVWRAGWKFSLLTPMDLVTLTDAGVGMNLTPVRITQVVELEDAAGIEFTAEDWPFGTASATLYPSEENDGHRPNLNVAPGDTIEPAIFNGPLVLTNGALELWVAPSGGQYWGGCEIWISTDLGSTYRKYATTTEKAAYGLLNDDLATGDAYPLIDSVNTAKVDPSAGTDDPVPASVGVDDFNSLVTLCYCDGEFLAYQDAALVSGHYELSTLYRGLYASTIQALVAAGTPFVYCESGLAKVPFPIGQTGQVLYFKFPAFNVYGNALQSLADCTPVVYTIATPAGGGSIDSISTGSTSAPCDGGGSTVVTWTDSGLPGGVDYSVQIRITSGTYDGEVRNYGGVTSGDTLNAPFCPGESFDVTVTALVSGSPIATLTDGFTS